MQAIETQQPSPQAPVGTSIITKMDRYVFPIAPGVFQKTLVLVVPVVPSPIGSLSRLSGSPERASSPTFDNINRGMDRQQERRR
jgi:hypothetical protein